jgi:hypothetical protein
MADVKVEEAGGFDAKNNADKGPKDAAGKAIGYEDDATRKREDRSASEKDDTEPAPEA